MGLFKSTVQTEYDKMLRKVQRCKNQKKLGRYALETKRMIVWQTAVDKITDEQILCQLAENNENEPLGAEAAKQMKDPVLLRKVVLSETAFFNAKITALRALNDQNLAEQLARTDDSSFVRQAALEILADEALVTQIAVSDPSFHIREWAAKHVNDQEALLHLAKTDEAGQVRSAAIARIKDERTRMELALRDRDVDLKDRLRALELLDPDDATLEELATQKQSVMVYEDFRFREEVVRRMNDPDALVHAVQKSTSANRGIVGIAAAKITDRAHLYTLLEGKYTAEAALHQLARLGMLDDEALQHVHSSLSEEAVSFARDEAVFYDRLRTLQGGSELTAAYDEQDVKKLTDLATPEAAEALVLLLRGEREKRDSGGGPTGLALSTANAIFTVWRNGRAELHDILREANNWPIQYHKDNGADDEDCHWDVGPIKFNF